MPFNGGGPVPADLVKAALAMRDEVAALPSPADLVGDIENLVTAAP